MNEKKIYEFLSNDKYNNIFVCDKTKSTNTLLRERAVSGNAPCGSVIIAREQTQGKGRLGRSFFSPSESGLYMSVLLSPDLPTHLVTVAAAVAMSQAIYKISGKTPDIKWVNDLFLNEKKICGILSESAFDIATNKFQYIILGIGVNVFMPDGNFPDDIKSTAGSVFDQVVPYAREQLAAEFLNNLACVFDFDFISEYKKRCLIKKGMKIAVISNGKTSPATVTDIDDCCRLGVLYDNGKSEYLSSGEVSIRRFQA